MMRRLKAARYLVDFDSGVGMVRAVGRFLAGKDHHSLGVGPRSRLLANLVSSLPTAARRGSFSGMGVLQGVPLDQARQISADDLAEWVVSHYGKGPFPAVLVGSASGAAVHLAAALGAPYLPQTLLTSVRELGTHPDEPIEAMEALAPIARAVARRNPEVMVYHMHDPAQDRPMLEGMAYLRLKRQRLGRVFERFLEERLAPGGTIISLECRRTWRSRSVGERAVFQFGALGGVPEEEYHASSDRIADYLQREASPHRSWTPPEPDGRRAEAEWGFDDALRPDLERVADRFGYSLRRLTFDEPQDLSPFVAELYRSWYGQRGLPGQRLLVESYCQWDPFWVLRLGAVPFWCRFNMQSDYDELEAYLAEAEPYDDIHVNLFSQGLWSPGVVHPRHWRALVDSAARHRGELIGVDEKAYPLDMGSSLRYQPAFAAIKARHPLPTPLAVSAIDEFLASGWHHPRMAWE